METSLKTGFAQIFCRCPKNLSCPKFRGAAAPLAPPARTPMLQKEMNEEFELITVRISLAATAMNENNCRTATGKPAFSVVMQSMSRHVILPSAFGKEERTSSTLCTKTFMK